QEGEGPRTPIIRELARRILENPDGTVTLTLDALESLEAAPPAKDEYRREAILDDDKTMYFASVVENLMSQVRSICRVRGHADLGMQDKGGTGFLVDGEAIGAPHRGPVLVTNAHVLSEDPKESKTLHPTQTETHFERWKDKNAVALGDKIWESPPDEFDVSVWHLKDLPDEALSANVCKRANPFPAPNKDLDQTIGTVVPIGHPGGRSLTFSFGSNPILDHDLHRDQGSIRLAHYKADTEGGSSGCPVFDRSGAVVAIHRAFSTSPIEGSPKPFDKNYAANEGVGIHSVARACRRSLKADE
ncbi:MAG: serine protease, partial [Acidobacteriota bacterium]|nr:serine protease [Acidobacteriota bacterium]